MALLTIIVLFAFRPLAFVVAALLASFAYMVKNTNLGMQPIHVRRGPSGVIKKY